MSQTDQPPGLLDQAASFAQAVAEWTAAGFPKRTPDQVARIQKICENCPTHKYRNDPPRCNECGCKMEPAPVPLTLGLIERPGKWEMATTFCPDGHWDRDVGEKHWGNRIPPNQQAALVDLKTTQDPDNPVDATFQTLSEQPAEVIVSFKIEKDPVSGLFWIPELKRAKLAEAQRVIADFRKIDGEIRWLQAANPYYRPANQAGPKMGIAGPCSTDKPPKRMHASQRTQPGTR